MIHILLVIRSVTDVLRAQSRFEKFVKLKVHWHVTSMLRRNWLKLIGGVIRTEMPTAYGGYIYPTITFEFFLFLYVCM